MLNDVDWYAENDITLHLGKKIVEDRPRAAAWCIAEDGTDSRSTTACCWRPAPIPFILPVPGKDLKGVIAYRDIADTNAMIDAAASAQARGRHRRRPARAWKRPTA